MILLAATDESLEVVLAGAITTNQPQIVGAILDETATGHVPGSINTQANSATPVTAVAAPAASTFRHVRALSIYNKDTVGVTVIVSFDKGATTREIVRAVLATLESLHYEHGTGWYRLDATGARV